MFTIQTVTNLKWNNSDKTSFSADVKYVEFNESHPTGVDAVDQYAHIKELWEKGNAGEYGVIADWVEVLSVQTVSSEQPQTNNTQTL